MPELFFEIRSGEIPARMQQQALLDLKNLLSKQLHELHLNFAHIHTYISPRRLVAVVDDLPLRQPDRLEERKGPRLDAPASALEGFMKSTGKALDSFEIRETPKGKFYFYVSSIPGDATTNLIPSLVESVIQQMPWPKNMTWGKSQATWVRPILGGCCVFDDQAISFDLNLSDAREDDPLIVSFDGQTVGHRFLAPQSFAVRSFADYKQKLSKAFVMIDGYERHQIILSQLKQLCHQHKFKYQEDLGLLEEVVGLVEWPVTYLGQIEEQFMKLPAELLSMTMKVHQRYFTLWDQEGNLAPYFAVVANIPGSDQGKTLIEGNERVLKARFSDADFYYYHDLKIPLGDHAKKLSSIIFHAQLGTMEDKAYRLSQLSSKLSVHHLEREKLKDAALLCKADLVTDLVREFPELQGIIGSYYAKASGFDPGVYQAIAEQYLPRGPNDSLPTSKLGLLLTLSDRIDTLTGFFTIGIKPTGSKDPFALRRAALGVIRILESQFEYILKDLLRSAYELYLPLLSNQKVSTFDEFYSDIENFFIDRMKVYWRDQGFPYDYVNAILGQGLSIPIQTLKLKLLALNDFLKDPEGEGNNLLIGYRRATSIVRIESEKSQTRFETTPLSKLFEKREEHNLFAALQETEKKLNGWDDEHYPKALAELAKLRPLIDQFFEHVTVNVEDPQQRENRLNLLAYIKRILDQVADFSQIEGVS